MDQNYPNDPMQPVPQQQPASPETPGTFTPQPVSGEVKSYTASPYDRFQPGGSDGAPVPPPPKTKPQKTVSLTTSVLISVITAVIASVLVFSVMMYGTNIGDMLNAPTSSKSDSGEEDGTDTGNQTTNIVVDTTASTSAEAVAEKAGPSVVGIVVSGSSYYYSSGSEGSGIIYTADGYVITNYHVIQTAVENGGTVSVYLPSDSENGIAATVVGYDISSDLAVLKIDQTGLPAIEFADSDSLKVGQVAIAIGNPGGMDFMGSVSMGIISGLDRTLLLENATTEINLIQTDAAINPGNSGGALVNSTGQLIGINSAKMALDNFEGMGFAIPSNDAKAIIDRIIKNQDAPQPYVGIIINTQYTSTMLQQMGLPAGVVVDSVASGSPADDAGLKSYDIVTHINNVAVTSYTQFNSEKLKYEPGDSITLTVYRGGRTYTAQLTLETANQ